VLRTVLRLVLMQANLCGGYGSVHAATAIKSHEGDRLEVPPRIASLCPQSGGGGLEGKIETLSQRAQGKPLFLVTREPAK